MHNSTGRRQNRKQKAEKTEFIFIYIYICWNTLLRCADKIPKKKGLTWIRKSFHSAYSTTCFCIYMHLGQGRKRTNITMNCVNCSDCPEMEISTLTCLCTNQKPIFVYRGLDDFATVYACVCVCLLCNTM